MGEHAPVEARRAGLERLTRFGRVVRNTMVEPAVAAGVPAEWVAAPGVGRSRTMLYLHGGGYSVGSPRTHRALVSRLSRAASARALVIDYRLAPEHPFPAALDDALDAYRWLITEHASPERMVIAGDSAGGGLAVSTLVRARDEGLPMPAAVVVFSPWTDLAATGESMVSKREEDPWLSPDRTHEVAAEYLADADPRDPGASPIYADLHGLPPTLIQVGTSEILLDDSRRLAERIRAAGGSVLLDEWTGMLHVFQGFAPYVTEARRAIEQVGSFVDRVVPPVPVHGSR